MCLIYKQSFEVTDAQVLHFLIIVHVDHHQKFSLGNLLLLARFLHSLASARALACILARLSKLRDLWYQTVGRIYSSSPP